MGWYTGFTVNVIQFSSYTPVVKNVSLIAKWQINQYTVSFDTNGGSLIDSITQDYGVSIIMDVVPEKEGHTFMGWTPELPEKIPAQNIEISAEWQTNVYTIFYTHPAGTVVELVREPY